MRALSYLLITSMKNAFFQLVKKPVMLIVGIIFAGIMLMSMISGGSRAGSVSLDLIRAGAFGLLGFIAYNTISKGLKQGSTFFSMPDVNMIFTSPIRPQIVLMYGVIRQMGVSSMATLFMCFQIPNMRNLLHLKALGIFALISGWFFLLLVSQILSLCTYSLTAPYPKRRRAGNIVMYGLIGLIAMALIVYLAANGGQMKAVIDFFGLSAVSFFPVVGWMNAYIFGLINGDIVSAVLFLLLTAFFPALCIALVRRTNSDYYEDVLQTTEMRYNMRQALKEGKAGAKNMNLRARTGKSGLMGKGRGASVFFYRQLTEQRRTGRMLLDFSSIIVIVIAAIGGIIFRNLAQRGQMKPIEMQIIAVSALIYTLYFVTMTGKFTQELNKPFLYMVPESAVLKLFYSNLSTVVKSLVEGAIAFSIIAALAGLPIWYVAAAAVLYATMSQMYISISILTQRIQGGANSKILGAFLYLICTGILVVPTAIIFGVLQAIFYFSNQNLLFISYLATIVYNLAISALVLFIGKGILKDANT